MLYFYQRAPHDPTAPDSLNDPGEKVLRTLRQLEKTDSILDRTAALSHLLDVAADQPRFEVEGVLRNLKDELPARIAQAFPTEPDDDELGAEAFETVLLAISARISHEDTRPGHVLRAWALSRWLGRCLKRSPFHGGDLERLTLQLRHLLRQVTPLDEQAVSQLQREPLHPIHFLQTALEPDEGISLRDLTFVGACLHHYRRGGKANRTLMPLPLVTRLQRLAQRPLTPEESRWEAGLPSNAQAPLGELRWQAPHMAPPLVAAWLLTSEQVSWMHTVTPERLDAYLEQLQTQPTRFTWLCRAALNDAAQLSNAQRCRLHPAWQKIVLGHSESPEGIATRLSPVFATMLGGAVLPQLTQDDQKVLLKQLSLTESRWHYGLYDALLGQAEALAQPELWERIFQQGLSQLTPPSSDATLQHTLATRLLTRASGSRLASRADALNALARACAKPPYLSSRLLWDELERLGYQKQGTKSSAEGQARP